MTKTPTPRILQFVPALSRVNGRMPKAVATVLLLVALALPTSAGESGDGSTEAADVIDPCDVLFAILEGMPVPEPDDCSITVDPCDEEPCDCPDGDCEPPLGACPPGQVGLVIGEKPFCQDIPVQCDSGIGVEPVCVVIEPCEPPQVGIIINRFSACATVPRIEFCQAGEIGIVVNGQPFCQPLPEECDEPAIGVDPACIEVGNCPPPAVGFVVNNFEACFTVEKCPNGDHGIVINKMSACVENEDPCDHAPESPWQEGVFLVSACGQDYYAPLVGPPPLTCHPGSFRYTGSYGAWCASAGEIIQDSIPDDPIPLLFPENEEDTAETSLYDDTLHFLDLVEADPVLLPASVGVSDGDVQSEEECHMVTCTVVFVRGYDSWGDGSGYGGWDPIRDWYLDHGYLDYEMVDTYGSCVGTANLMGHGSPHADPHDVWFAANHKDPNSCSPKGHHGLNTGLRHMAYHMAWWIFDTYGETPVDIVAHSMGGLITRYALHMVSTGDPNWPPALNVQDVVTLGTPHLGAGISCLDPTTQGKNMCWYKKTIKWMKANAQDPQGVAGTQWTLIGSLDDNWVSEESTVGMTAYAKLWYDKEESSTQYEHNDYYKDDSDAMDGNYYWQVGGGDWKYSKNGPHSIKRAWWGSASASH